MTEEYVEDIISAAVTTESSSTEADKTITPDSKLSVANESSKDQSSNQTKTDNSNADKDQTNSKLSVEELAAQLGWRSDHEGEDAVDAITYILRSKDIQKSMGKHNKDLKEQLTVLNSSVDALKQHNERVYQADVKRLKDEIATLRKERKSAIELADVDKVEELDAQIEERQKDIEAPKINTTKSEVANPVFDEWILDNDWYLKDPEMAKYADNVAQNYVGAPLPRIYSLVRQRVQEVFPDKFASSNSSGANAPVDKGKPIGPVSPVDRSTNNKGNSSSFTKADLTAEQVNIMNQFVRGGIMTEEQYIKDIASMQE